MAIIAAKLSSGETITLNREVAGVYVATKLIDENDWASDANGDGRLYPEQYRIYQKKILSHLPFLLVDETGWNGHDTCPDRLIAAFAVVEDARDFRTSLLR